MKPPKILHRPSKKDLQQSQFADYLRWLAENEYPKFEDYASLHQWSVEHLEDFWETIWKWGEMRASHAYNDVLERRKMPGAKWFSGARLNFAENLLRFALSGDVGRPAITAHSESRPPIRLTYGELLERVGSLAAFLRANGVGEGDRVAGIVAHAPEAVIAMLATTSIGAIWSSCSPDFGAQGILDRFSQIEPKVLIAINGYRYNGKDFPISDRIEAIRSKIASIKAVVVVDHLPGSRLPAGSVFWASALEANAPLRFAQLPFDHPVYILYSSGTTGVPKCIVHGAGGVLLQHIKELRLHTDLRADDRFFYYTTCGWMMWNWQVSGLVAGAELMLFDGSPSHPTLDRLWSFIEEEKITIFGTSAKFLGSCRTSKLSPKAKHDLDRLRVICSTGSPLLPEDFDWVYANVGKQLVLSSISGGTDIVSCFVLGNSMLPVYRGEIQCGGLGMAVKAFSDQGKEVINEKGELVCTEPAPSMPVSFWNDADGSKYRKAYFSRYPGIWWHGDYITFNERGGAVIHGRSDATLNPGGVRIGTAEIYRQVETLEEVKDSLAVGQPWEGDERVILFVVLKEGFALTPALEKKIRTRIREETTPRHVPAKIVQIREVPYTISGKKVELAVAKILRGEHVENRDALANPSSLDQFVKILGDGQLDPNSR